MKDRMNIPFSPPDITEEEVQQVAEALRSGWITTGPKTKEFERQIAAYIGTNKAACLSSATAAMEMTLRLLGIGEGDEVILPAYTYTATCSVVCHVGATPVLADIQKDTPQIDYDKLAERITEKTKVIIPVDLGGIPCDYERIFEVLNKAKDKFHPGENSIQKQFDRVIVMADASHAFGAERDGKYVGQIADFTCFSFHAVKNLTTAEGGAVTWKRVPGIENDWIYQQYMNLSLHGQSKDAFHKTKAGSWEYDILFPAYKCNMTDIQAGIGLAQLERYPQMLEKRHSIIQRYDSAFASYPVQLLNHKGTQYRSSGHLYLMRIAELSESERNDLIERFAQQGVAVNVHYKPLPMLTAYKNMGFDIEDYPNSYDFYKNEITLPLYSKLTEEEVSYIIGKVKKILQEFCR